MPSTTDTRIGPDGIGHAIADSRLTVPAYQRSFAWEDEHVEELLNDLSRAIEANDAEYFLGSIVVSNEGTAGPEIVDGQQRLATVTILLAAIRDYFHSENESARVSGIENRYLFSINLRTEERHPRLRLNDLDNHFFESRILAQPSDSSRKLAATAKSHKLLANAAEIARKHVATIVGSTTSPHDALLDWVEYIHDSVKVVWFQVPDHANAFMIFETLNDRGLDLAISDLLKNYLFHLAADRWTEAQANWLAVIGVMDAIGTAGGTVTYIRHLWSSQHGLTRERDLYKAIKTRISSKRKALDFSALLKASARMYAAIANPDSDFWDPYGEDSRSCMRTLNELGAIRIRPLVLAVLMKFSKPEVRKAMRVLVAWTVRFLISGGGGSGTVEERYCELAASVMKGSTKTTTSLI